MSQHNAQSMASVWLLATGKIKQKTSFKLPVWNLNLKSKRIWETGAIIGMVHCFKISVLMETATNAYQGNLDIPSKKITQLAEIKREERNKRTTLQKLGQTDGIPNPCKDAPFPVHRSPDRSSQPIEVSAHASEPK